jgi:hypothetical protein
MTVIWLNGTVGPGKSAVGRALAAMVPGATFVDGDDVAPDGVAGPARWRMAVDALVRRVSRRRIFFRVRAAWGRAKRRLLVVTLATPLAIVLRGRGARRLHADERARARQIWSQGYTRPRFAAVTLPNARPPAALTARRIVAVFVLISFLLVCD